MLPNFLIIGAMKGGTTSLYRYLSDHPQIFMPSVKEPLFFSSNWDRGLDWYERLFEGAGQVAAIGEASTEYTAYPHIPDVPMRVAKLLPEVRLVYIVRHPIERMLSEYHYNLVRGLERDPSADKALLQDSTYYNVSCYALQIEQYLEHFSRDQLLVLKSEDLRRDRVRTLGRVYEFLGVDGTWQPTHLWEEFQTSSKKRSRRHVDNALRKVPGYRRLASLAPQSLKQVKYRLTTRKAPPKPSLSEGARRELKDRLRDDVRRLRDHLGEDVDEWGVA
jgi:hypothetical protein